MIGTVDCHGLVHGIAKLSVLTQSPLSLCGSGFPGAALEPITVVTCVRCVVRKLR